MAQRRFKLFEPGVLLLILQIIQYGLNNIIPAVTTGFIAFQLMLYVGVIPVWWELTDVCISAESVLFRQEWKRLFISSMEHGDDMHINYNMVSFLIKGRVLERKYGWRNYILLLPTLIILTNLSYVVTAPCASLATGDPSINYQCAIGFSSVIFALKVLTTFEDPREKVQIHKIFMPGIYAVWVELILIHLLVPNSSLIGHLSGIIAGLTYCHTYLGRVIDSFITSLTGKPMPHAYNTKSILKRRM